MQIEIDKYPQLKQVAWSRPNAQTISDVDAFALLERNWDYVWVDDLTKEEVDLILTLQHMHNGLLLRV